MVGSSPYYSWKIQHWRLISCFASPVILISRILISQCLNYHFELWDLNYINSFFLWKSQKVSNSVKYNSAYWSFAEEYVWLGEHIHFFFMVVLFKNPCSFKFRLLIFTLDHEIFTIFHLLFSFTHLWVFSFCLLRHHIILLKCFLCVVFVQVLIKLIFSFIWLSNLKKLIFK